MYIVSDWDSLYEVCEHSHVWVPGKKKRKKPIPYLRYDCEGRGAGAWKTLAKKLCRENNLSFAVLLGIHLECLGIAANQNSEHRGGALLNFRQKPLDIAGVAELADISIEEVTSAFQILLDPRLGVIREIKESASKPKRTDKESKDLPGNVGECRGIPNQIISDQIISDQIKHPGDMRVCIPTKSDYEVYELDATQLDDLQKKFPMVDVVGELNAVRERLLEKPNRKPRPEKAAKFVLECLSRASKPKVSAEAVQLSEMAVMRDIERKWPQASKTDIADLFGDSVDMTPARLEALNDAQKKAATYAQFEKLARGIAA